MRINNTFKYILVLTILSTSLIINGQCLDVKKYAYNCDFDGDGILNVDDFDDDNDGIMDNTEQGDLAIPLSLERWSGKTSSGYSTAFLKNEYYNHGFTDITTSPVTWKSGQVFGQPWDNLPGHDDVRDIDKIYMDAFKLDQHPTPPTITVRFARPVTNPILLFNHIKRAGNYDFALTDPDYMYMVDNSIGATISGDSLYFPADNTSNGAVRGWSVCLVGTFDSIVFKSYATVRESQGFSLMVPGDIDTDGDGIPNRFDYDSDNDECFDAIEGGGSFLLADVDSNGMLTGSVDGNGVPTAAGSDGQAMGSINDSTVSTCVELTDAGTGDMSNGIDSSDGWASTWADIDGDGDEDLFMCDKDRDRPNRVYRNNNDGTFTKDLTTGLSDYTSKTSSAMFGDYDNDGDEDCYILNTMEAKCRLWNNDGTGNFTKVTGVGLPEIPQYFMCGAWVDIDNDGYLDMILASYFETEFHQVYKNKGDGTFQRDRNCAIAKSKSRASSLSICDINNDGLPDVFFPNGDSSTNFLFINKGGFEFSKLDTGEIVNDINSSVACTWGDYDNDGYQDCYVVNASQQKNCLYKNNKNGTFSKVTSTVTTDKEQHTQGANWFDCDNDGDLDLLVTNDQGKNELYENDGASSFTRSTERTFLTYDCGGTISASISDYNRDGKQDVYFNNRSKQSNRLYKNERSNSNKHLNIKLKGTNANKDGYGSNIKVKAGGKWQTRYCTPGSGIGSGNSKRNSFGCGNNATVDSIVIQWPSGKKQCLTNQNTDRFLTIEESASCDVTVKTFNDENGNCVQDAGEEIVANKKIQITENGSSHKTDDNGEFTTSLECDTYTFTANDMKNWEMTCTTSVNITTDTTLLIPLSEVSSGPDLEVSSGTTACRRGFPKQTNLTVENNGTETAYDCEIVVVYPPEVDYKSCDVTPTAVSGDTVTWELDSLVVGEQITIEIQDSVTTAVSIGDTIHLESSIEATVADIDITDNSFMDSEEVLGAIDPNDLLVYPAGEGRDGYIDREQKLTYKIRFQNVGTYMATYVHLNSDLPKGLDLSTFKMKRSSHDVTEVRISEDGHLYVYYKDINLLDSNTSEPASHGFFEYTIYPKKDVAEGEKLKNRVDISFDYEDPIRTNTITHTIKVKKKTQRFDLDLYPNPAQKRLNIEISDYAMTIENVTELREIQVVSSNGQIMHEVKRIGSNYLNIDVSGFPNGLYFIKGIDTIGNLHIGQFVK